MKLPLPTAFQRPDLCDVPVSDNEVDIITILNLMRSFKQPFLLLAFTLVAFIVTAIPARAQVGFKIGLLGGEDFAGSQTMPSPFPNSTAQGATGYVFGLAYEQSLFGPLSILSEMFVVQRTFKDATTFPSGSPNQGNAESWIQKLTYLQTPILLKITPADWVVAPFVFIGPNIGFKLSATTVTDTSGVPTTYDQNSLFNFIDLGLDVGGGLQAKILPIMWLFADVRYTFGLVDVYNSVTTSNAGNPKARDVKWTGGVMVGF